MGTESFSLDLSLAGRSTSCMYGKIYEQIARQFEDDWGVKLEAQPDHRAQRRATGRQAHHDVCRRRYGRCLAVADAVLGGLHRPGHRAADRRAPGRGATIASCRTSCAPCVRTRAPRWRCDPHFVGALLRERPPQLAQGSMITRGRLLGYSPNRHEFDGRSGTSTRTVATTRGRRTQSKFNSRRDDRVSKTRRR